MAATVGVTSLFFVHNTSDALVYEQGRPWNYPKLTAPFDIPIHYDSIATKRITDSIDNEFVPIFRDTGISDSQVNKLYKALSELDGISPATTTAIVNLTREMYSAGIVDNETSESIANGKLPQVRLLDGNEMTSIETAAFRSSRDCYAHIDSTLTTPEQQSALDRVQIYKYLQPNFEADSTRNRELLDDSYKVALAPHGIKQKGEKIIDYGDIVTPQRFVLIKTYEQMMNERELSPDGKHYSIVGYIAIFTLLMIVFYIFMRAFKPEIFWNIKKMVLLITSILVFVSLVYGVTRLRMGFIYLVPFTLVPIVITTFTDSRVGFFVHMIVVLLCSFVMQDSDDFIIMQFMAGIVAAASVQALMRRSQLVRCAFFIFLIYSASYVASLIFNKGNLQSLDWQMFLFYGINCTVLSFAYFGIFIIEKIFGFTSIVTLVELSDINNPVLRELSQHCPGTFQHSLQVANLAGEAAHEVGANVQLTRAGALYHDIGKIENPAFFTENQTGVNPHDALLPEQSAHIIIQHVADGLKRAERERLPQVIRDFITEHHGKSRVKFFYRKAQDAAPEGTVVDPAPYTYPGPNPRSREAAIVMMADACEAAAKSLQEPTEENISAVVNRIIDGMIAEGLFNQSPISFKDIQTVKTCLVARLRTFYHMRVSYPDDIRPLASQPQE